MSQLAPLAVGIPLLGAALLAAGHKLLGRAGSDLLALGLALASAVLVLILLVHVGSGLSIYWFGGWHPRQGLAVGIDFAVEPIGAALAAFVALLMVVALLYSAKTEGVEAPYYHVLMLTFMTGMIGFCLSGDLFNMFVFFELMSVSAVALIAYKVREQAAIEGGLNFAVINSIGAFLFLLGIGLIYAHTGALNLAQIGRTLSHYRNDRVVVVAFALIASALLIKAAIVPFHFWLDDAYAVALAPVCLLLAGAMSEMGLYGLGRVWYGVFGPVMGTQVHVVRAILVGAGLLTAVWGSAMALQQDHLKRLLAFVTIGYVGIFLTGLGLLTADGVAGTGVYVLADGCGKALLFALVGILQHRFGSVSQQRLHGRARGLRVTAAMFFAGGLLISSLPPFGPFLGKSMIEDAANKVGYGFVPPLIVLSSALAGAAVLRAGARVFLGWGEPSQQDAGGADEQTEPETEGQRDRTPPLMLVSCGILLAGTIGFGVWFGFADLAETAARRFISGSAYQAIVFGRAVGRIHATSASPAWYDWLYCGGATLLAVGFAALGLFGRRWGAGKLLDLGQRAMTPVRLVHTGRIGDYTAALSLGVGILGGLLVVTLR
ncbi:MAG TPA: proton-conducting transporter membrane subunit [Solirubrobacteraceae bacterium]|nr:proton-conducting transporter membrane subunit [Solirubrobacteraceae bacterium]